MKTSLLRLVVPIACLASATLPAQPPASPVYSQTLTFVKVETGKGADYEKLLSETVMKVNQQRANAGEIISWTLLRCVLPAGQEARASHVISIVSEGAPIAPMTRTAFEAALKQAGVTMTVDEFYDRRRSLVTLVSQEIWRPRARVGAPRKGHYIFLDYMRVQDAAAYYEAEQTVWLPIHAERIKRGEMSGWMFATKMLPGGTESPYGAYTANIYPTWQAAFGPRASTQSIFETVHPGKNFEETISKGLKRDLARRELWVVVERVEKST